MPFELPTDLPACLPTCLPTYLPTYLPTLPTYLPTYLLTYLQNGSGKSTLLKCIASRSVPIPDFVDIWFLDKEADPSDRTAMETVIDTVRYEKAPTRVGKGSAAGGGWVGLLRGGA